MTKESVLCWLVLVILCSAPPAWAEVPANAVWIDVRSPTEYASGHLQQATLIPFDGIEAGVAQLQLSKDTPIYLYCAVGGRAAMAKKRLEFLNYNNVTNAGGLEDARKLSGDPQP
jgi:phage shock protein E